MDGTQLARILARTSDSVATLSEKVQSGGMVNHERALRLAALLSMVLNDVAVVRALDRLGLQSPERELIRDIAERFLDELYTTSRT